MFYSRSCEASTKEFLEEGSVVFTSKQYGSDAREFFNAGSVRFGYQKYSRSEFCEQFSEQLSFGRH